jgi:N-methylhydantoinase B
MMIGLDLRAKVGANTVGRDRMLAVIGQYGADTVKAVMKRMMTDAESRLRGKLRTLPDGTWRATGYQDQSHSSDRGLHKITVAMTKSDGHLAFDFTGTDPQSGVVNCTYAGMRGGVMLALLPILAGDIPWSAGGLMRCFDLVADEGTLNNASFPAAVGRGPIGPAWLTGNLVAECLSQMLDQSQLGHDTAHVQSSCCGTWDTAVIAGLDQRGAVPTPFLSILMDPMAGGYGAQPQADGMDTGGLFCIPLGRVPDVEMTEFLYPVLALWRREEPDSGGPGRRRGGVSASMAITPHGTSFPIGLVLASNGKAISQNNGLAGGYPGNTGIEWIARGADVTTMLGAGKVPADLDEVGGSAELQPCYGETHVAPGEVFTMFWQGGGGYGDPLVRDPEDVARDVREDKVTVMSAAASYGVVLDGTGAVDAQATENRRRELRDARRARGGSQETRPTIDVSDGRRLDDNLVAVGDQVACTHCATLLGSGAVGELDLVRHEGPVSEAGPQVVDAAGEYVDREVHFRQYCCPGCFTAISTAVVPVDHVDDITRTSRVLADARS